jgi:hypothetical protein
MATVAKLCRDAGLGVFIQTNMKLNLSYRINSNIVNKYAGYNNFLLLKTVLTRFKLIESTLTNDFKGFL